MWVTATMSSGSELAAVHERHLVAMRAELLDDGAAHKPRPTQHKHAHTPRL
jgi:hypothetical protein